jgi:hypothetical protein
VDETDALGVVDAHAAKRAVTLPTIAPSAIHKIYDDFAAQVAASVSDAESPVRRTAASLADLAFGHLTPTNGSGIPEYARSVSLSRRTTRDRIILDVITLPLLAVIYWAFKILCAQVFTESSGSKKQAIPYATVKVTTMPASPISSPRTTPRSSPRSSSGDSVVANHLPASSNSTHEGTNKSH